jgi:hypothetical protein
MAAKSFASIPGSASASSLQITEDGRMLTIITHLGARWTWTSRRDRRRKCPRPVPEGRSRARCPVRARASTAHARTRWAWAPVAPRPCRLRAPPSIRATPSCPVAFRRSHELMPFCVHPSCHSVPRAVSRGTVHCSSSIGRGRCTLASDHRIHAQCPTDV